MIFRSVFLIALAAVFVPAQRASAHDARPIVVNIEESEGEIHAEWRVPKIGPIVAQPELVMPEGCRAMDDPVKADLGDSELTAVTYACSAPLAGSTIELRHPIANPGLSTLFRVKLRSGEIRTAMLPPGKTLWTIPADPTRFGVVRDYLFYGIRHIATGPDHLLFLVCLMLLASTRRQMLTTVTGFTVAHSITLGLSAYDLVRLPSRSVEFAVALSIVFVAAEIARSSKNTITHRHPAAVSSAFGLLHGFGFASVLRQAGLPHGESLTALFCFNAGVEIGQILFIAFVWLELAFVIPMFSRRLPRMAARRAPGAIAYAVGILAMYWSFERFLGQ